jgi:hypothetical protein
MVVKMKTFNQYITLTEGFDKPVKWRWDDRPDPDSSLVIATFEIEGRMYEVEFQNEFYQEEWTLSFAMWQRGMRDYEMTGTGSAFKVFATVIDILKDFLRIINPYIISFSSSEKSRTSLYMLMTKKIGRVNRRYKGHVITGSAGSTRGTFMIKDRQNRLYDIPFGIDEQVDVNEGIDVIDGIRFLVNPSKQQLKGFLKRVVSKGGRSVQGNDLRGLIADNSTIYWWEAQSKIHYTMGEALGVYRGLGDMKNEHHLFLKLTENPETGKDEYLLSVGSTKDWIAQKHPLIKAMKIKPVRGEDYDMLYKQTYTRPIGWIR